MGDADTRGAIIAAARAEFGDSGYNATTIRAVARRAEVDPALVYHYFGDKPTLYMATVELPMDPRRIREAAGSSPSSPGTELVAQFLAQWELGPGRPGQRFVTVVQAVSSSPEVARTMREFLTERVWVDALEDDETAHWRRALVSSLLVGLAWNRYLMAADPLASASRHDIATRMGPVLDRVMAGAEDEPG